MRTFGCLRELKKAWILSLTTVYPTSTQKHEKLNIYPGVAQLGARVVWDHQAAGSIPVTRTIMNVHNGLMSTMSILFLLCLGLEPLVDGAQTGYEYKYTTTVDFRCDL